MAESKSNSSSLTPDLKRMEDMNKELVNLLRSESIAFTGDDGGRSDELLNIHHRYNNIIQQDYQGVKSSKDSTDSTYDYIANALIGHKDYGKAQQAFRKNGFTTGNAAQDKLLKNVQLDKLFTMGDTQIASYFLSTSSDIIHIYDEIDSVCSYFYQLEEANLIIRDNVLRAEQVNEDISMDIDFPGVTDDTSAYVSIVKKALEYQKMTIKIRDHVAPKAIKYGTYYIMIIPYSEIGMKLIAINNSHGMGYGGIPFYESTDTHALFGDNKDYDSCMESVTSIFESIDPTLEESIKSDKLSNDQKVIQETINIIKENAKQILVCEDTSIPDIEGLGSYKKLDDHIQNAISASMKATQNKLIQDIDDIKSGNVQFDSKIGVRTGSNKDKFASYIEAGKDIVSDLTKKFVKDGELVAIQYPTDKKQPKETPEIGRITDNDKLNEISEKFSKKSTQSTDDGFTTNNDNEITANMLKQSDDVLGCHTKLVDPRQLVPIKIFDYVVGYYYFENYDYARMGTSVTDIMSNQMNFNQRNVVIDGIVDSVLKNLKYGDVLKGDNQLKSMILNCILYAERRDNPIRIKFVRPEFIIPWKTNTDEHDNGQPVILRSLLYARLYTSLILFYTTAIITKSTDSEFYYLKESALDGQINNQISDMMDQLEDSNVDPIQIANGNILHGNRAINKRFFLDMGVNEVKPFEMDVVSGQQIDMHNEFLTDLKKMAIGATGVPAVMVDYVDEIEYATMLGMANIKHLTRCNSIKKDFNGPLTETAKTLVKNCYPHAIPDNILDKMKISLRESKVINNNITNQQLNDNIGLCESMVKTYVGGDTTNPPEITAFIIEDMTRQLVIEQTPAAPWELLPDMYKQSLMKARQTKLYNQIQTKMAENQESSDSE